MSPHAVLALGVFLLVAPHLKDFLNEASHVVNVDGPNNVDKLKPSVNGLCSPWLLLDNAVVEHTRG
jgi:hypothetical protein